MCNYQGHEFGAGAYPDSCCIDGVLYDADNCDGDGNIYQPMEHIPCPICDSLGAVEYWTDRNSDGENDIESVMCAISLVNDLRQNRGFSKIFDGGDK